MADPHVITDWNIMAENKLMIDEVRLSFSSMKDFGECAKRYYYRVTAPKSAVPNVHMVFGSIVHDSIEKYEKNDRELGELVGWSLNEWDRQMASSQFLGGKAPRPPKSFKRMYDNYINDIVPRLSEDDAHIEYFFKILLSYSPDGETPIYFVGKIDRIDPNGIYDWKTSERLPDTYELASNQFFAYWWAHQEEFDADPEGMYYGHLGSGNLYNIDMSPVLLENFEALLDKMSREILNAWEQDEFPRIIGYQCKQCPFRGICFRELQEEQGNV